MKETFIEKEKVIEPQLAKEGEGMNENVSVEKIEGNSGDNIRNEEKGGG